MTEIRQLDHLICSDDQRATCDVALNGGLEKSSELAELAVDLSWKMKSRLKDHYAALLVMT